MRSSMLDLWIRSHPFYNFISYNNNNNNNNNIFGWMIYEIDDSTNLLLDNPTKVCHGHNHNKTKIPWRQL